MDLITTAITAALGHLTETMIKDAYDALKGAISKKFGHDSALETAVANLERQPDAANHQQTLSNAVAAAQADQDAELAGAAETLLEKLKAQADGQRPIQQMVTGNHNIFSGTGKVSVRLGNAKE